MDFRTESGKIALLRKGDYILAKDIKNLKDLECINTLFYQAGCSSRKNNIPPPDMENPNSKEGFALTWERRDSIGLSWTKTGYGNQIRRIIPCTSLKDIHKNYNDIINQYQKTDKSDQDYQKTLVAITSLYQKCLEENIPFIPAYPE